MKKLFAFTSAFLLVVGTTVNAQQLTGEFPEGGGKISVTASGGDVNAAGLDFGSASGGLVPVEGNAGSPFAFLLSNTANQVTYGNLGSTVTFADGSTTQLSVGAVGGTTDILASWGRGLEPVAFDVAEDKAPTPPPTPTNSTISWQAVNARGILIDDLIGDGTPITFSAAEYPGTTSGTASYFTGNGGDTGNAALNTILNSQGWSTDGATLVVDGLTANNNYEIQLLRGDLRACCATRTQTVSDGTNVSQPFAHGGGAVVGTFNALAESVSIEIAGDVEPGLAGYLLWNTTSDSLAKAVNFTSDGVSPTVTLTVIPEPSSQLMIVVAAAGALGLVRRRR